MHNYLVFMPEGEGKIEKKFPRAHYQLTDGLWAIGSPLSTCADVCEELGMESGSSGVVVSMHEYYGHFDRALWQKLAAWNLEA